MKKIFIPIISVLMLPVLFSSASFTDLEIYNNNRFEAGSIDISISPDDYRYEFQEEEGVSVPMNLINAGTNKCNYSQIIVYNSGSHDLYQNIKLTTKYNGIKIYDESLPSLYSFNSSSPLIPTTSVSFEYIFNISQSVFDNYRGSTVDLSINTSCWQQDHLSSGTGFYDNESLTITLSVLPEPLPLIMPSFIQNITEDNFFETIIENPILPTEEEILLDNPSENV